VGGDGVFDRRERKIPYGGASRQARVIAHGKAFVAGPLTKASMNPARSLARASRRG